MRWRIVSLNLLGKSGPRMTQLQRSNTNFIQNHKSWSEQSALLKTLKKQCPTRYSNGKRSSKVSDPLLRRDSRSKKIRSTRC